MVGIRKHQLEVRSTTLVGTSGPAVATEAGTRDPMPRIGDVSRTGALPMTQAGQGTADVMPEARGFNQIPGADSAPKTLPDQYVSWKALAAPEPPSDAFPGGMMAGAGGGEIGQEIGQPKHMPGVVQKNKAPF